MSVKRWLIIASGESAAKTLAGQNLADLSISVMTINSSWRLYPLAHVHYSNDGDWFEHEMRSTGILTEAKGLFFCGDPLRKVSRTIRHYLFHKNSRGLDMRPGCLAWGGNSGYAGINLAAQLGAEKIVLVGYDMKGASHWHGEHDPAVKKPFNFPMWVPRFKELADAAKGRGIEILNASPDSALTCFTKADIKGALEWLAD